MTAVCATCLVYDKNGHFNKYVLICFFFKGPADHQNLTLSIRRKRQMYKRDRTKTHSDSSAESSKAKEEGSATTALRRQGGV